MSEKIRVVVVGRHAPDLGGDAEKFEIVKCENVTFSLKRDECKAQLLALAKNADSLDASVLLQNTPGVVACALSDIIHIRTESENLYGGIEIGVIISVPGPRQAGVTETFNAGNDYMAGLPASEVGAELIRAVAFANARAKCETFGDCGVRVTVDPVTPFVYSHIEWL